MTSYNPQRRRLLLALGGLTFSSLAMGAHRSRMKPECQRGIPPANYQARSQSAVITVQSFPYLLVEDVAEQLRQLDDPKSRTVPSFRLFQLTESRVTIEQCELSAVALQLFEDGNWTLSLRGDQNRAPPRDSVNQFNPKMYIRRNEFEVRVRLYARYQQSTPPDEGLGKPVIQELGPFRFWVENGKPLYVREVGRFVDMRDVELLNYVDRVELDFSFR